MLLSNRQKDGQKEDDDCFGSLGNFVRSDEYAAPESFIGGYYLAGGFSEKGAHVYFATFTTEAGSWARIKLLNIVSYWGSNAYDLPSCRVN